MKILFAVIGWFAFNALILRLDKEHYDEENKTFPLGEFARKRWDDWFFSIFIVPILLIIDYAGLNINVLEAIEPGSLAIGDLQIFCSGFYAEVIFYAFKKWKKSKEV